MHFLHTIRQLHTWSRALLVGFVLAFGLNSIAHAAHQHDPASATSSLHSTICGYCLTFDNLAATPAVTPQHFAFDVDPFITSIVVTATPSLRPCSTTQPRAPPSFLN